MHLASIVTIASIVGFVSAAANPVANADADMSVPNAFEKRDCKYNGCKCKPGTRAGVYCGFCDAVTDAGSGSFTDVFQCNSKGSCCDYGPRQSCDKFPGFSPCG
jgi:hypothetical protein